MSVTRLSREQKKQKTVWLYLKGTSTASKNCKVSYEEILEL